MATAPILLLPTFEVGKTVRSFFKGGGAGDAERWQIQVEFDGHKAYRFYVAEGGATRQAVGHTVETFEQTELYKGAAAYTLFLDMRCLEDQPELKIDVGKKPSQAETNYHLIAEAFEVARAYYAAYAGKLTVVFFCVSGINRSVATSAFFAIGTWLLEFEIVHRTTRPHLPTFSLLRGEHEEYRETFDRGTFANFVLSFIAVLRPRAFRDLPKYVVDKKISAENRRADVTDYSRAWKGHPAHKSIVLSASAHLDEVLAGNAKPKVPPPPPKLPFFVYLPPRRRG